MIIDCFLLNGTRILLLLLNGILAKKTSLISNLSLEFACFFPVSPAAMVVLAKRGDYNFMRVQ